MHRPSGLAINGPPRLTEWSTASVDPKDSADFWRDVVCDLYVKLKTAPITSRFSGEVTCGSYPDFDLSVIRATAEQVRRSKSLIARSAETDEYLFATFHTAGKGVLEQAGRTAVLSPGSLVFYESSQPFFLQFDGPWEQVIIRIPVSQAYAMAGIRRSDDLLAVAIESAGPTAAVAAFVRSLAAAQSSDPYGTAYLAPHAVGLIGSLLGWAGARESTAVLPDFVRRDHVISFLSTHLGDPQLDIDAIARGCLMSRRTLFRLFEDNEYSVMGQLRVLRVESAMMMLRNKPDRPISAVARVCGFTSQAKFYRAFREVTATTPAAYRGSGLGQIPRRRTATYADRAAHLEMP